MPIDKHHSYRAVIPPVTDGAPRPLWSVMIPTFNCADYLRETLASVLAQDPGPEVMQIEVVDDHSTQDDPATVVKELSHGRVGFYRQPKNLGFIRNFETCLKRSRGKIIHLLHGDDRVRNGFYEKLGQGFDRSPEIGAAFCRHITMDKHGHWQQLSRLERPESGVLENWLIKIAAGQRLTTPSIVVRRDVYEALGGFDRRISCCGEDWEMWVRIATRFPVWHEVEPLAIYRIKGSECLSAGSVRTGGYIRDMRVAAEIVESYLPAYLDKTFAFRLTNRARKLYAHWAVGRDGTARQMFDTGDVAAAMALIREGIKCSHSAGTYASTVGLLAVTGSRWLWQRLSKRGVSLE